MSILIERFLRDLDGRLLNLQAAMAAEDRAALAALASELNDAATGCGLTTLGAHAADLARLALSDEADLNELRERVEALIDLCRRNRPGSHADDGA